MSRCILVPCSIVSTGKRKWLENFRLASHLLCEISFLPEKPQNNKNSNKFCCICHNFFTFPCSKLVLIWTWIEFEVQAQFFFASPKVFQIPQRFISFARPCYYKKNHQAGNCRRILLKIETLYKHQYTRLEGTRIQCNISSHTFCQKSELELGGDLQDDITR